MEKWQRQRKALSSSNVIRKVEPGCEIVVPTKTQRDRKTSLAEVLSIASSTTSMAAMVTSIINTLK